MNDSKLATSRVHQALRHTARVHARHRAFLFFLRAALILLLLIPLLIIADILFHFSDAVRLTSGIGLLLLGVGVFLATIGIAVFFRAPILRLARLLESRNPALGSKLVNILQLEEEAARYEENSLTKALARQAISDAGSNIPVATLPKLAREPRLKGHGKVLAGAIAVIVLLSIFGGRHVHNEWLRFLDPFGDHPPFSLTRLEIVSPIPDREVLYGDGFTVEVTAKGHQPKELFLTAVSEGNQQTIALSARGDGTFVGRLENIIQPLSLTAHTANHSSRSHRRMLGLVLTPQITGAIVTVTPPAYTGLAARSFPFSFSALQALEGTALTFQLKSNRPLGIGSASLELSDSEPLSFPLSPEAETPSSARAEFLATQSGRLSFSLVDIEGNAATEAPTSLLTVTRDLPPAIDITAPERDAMVVENLTIPVIVSATDDYGLSSMRIHLAKNGEFIEFEPTKFSEEIIRRHELSYVIDLKAVGAEAGDKITLFAEAIDNRPEPQLTRTSIRSLEIISEEEYNQRLREEADVALIAGKYEDLLSRFEKLIAEQETLQNQLAKLAEKAKENPNDKELLGEFSEAFAKQLEINESLKNMAAEMGDFGRDNPVYDFEKDLQEKLREQAEAIEESIEKNQKESEAALEKGDPPPANPSQEMMKALEDAAREQAERLRGEHEKAEEEITEPLKDLANLHELMKDFNLFKQLAEQQQQLAEQTKAYRDKEELTPEDKLALRDLGAQQRDLAPLLQDLADKMRQDAEAAKEDFPEAAEKAQQLAEAIEEANMPDLARRAAQSMLQAQPENSHDQAENLHEEMQRLLQEHGEAGQQGVAQGLADALREGGGMRPGDTFGQMMRSRLFRSLPKDGKNGNGQGGQMASSAMDAGGMLLGSETLMNGPIARNLSGRGSNSQGGMSNAPTARLDALDESDSDSESARRTGTPQSQTLLMEYENLADAYFRKLTTQQ